MPTQAAHLLLAERNQKSLAYLFADLAAHAPWVTTIAFYKALHLVEAVFANDPHIRHGRTHEQRDQHLKSNKRYAHIYKHYRPLWAASMVARYLENSQTKDEVSSFEEYMPPEEVQSTIIGHYLRQVETSVAKLLSKAKSPGSR